MMCHVKPFRAVCSGQSRVDYFDDITEIIVQVAKPRIIMIMVRHCHRKKL